MASPSSSLCCIPEKYDVFISYSGGDTGDNFTSHLCNALRQRKLKVCLSDNLEISPEASSLFVIVFSENYASSPRLLDELYRIIQCKEEDNGKSVLPIFYNVSPSHVRKQQADYGAAIAAYGEQKQYWRDALTKAANLSGWDTSVARSESKLVDTIASDILRKLYATSRSKEPKGLFGVGKRAEKIESLLQMDLSPDRGGCVRIVGVCGVRGVGKTTLARVVFEKFASRFEGSHFLENVKGETEKHGMDRLRNRLFSALLGEKNVEERLKDTKVLVVLDDVDDIDQFEYLAGNRDLFCPGSRIVVTTRDEQVLNNIEVDGTYVVEELDSDEALKLFCSKAFLSGNSPASKYLELSKRMIGRAKGVPLAIRDLGHRLRSRSIEVWESELSQLEKSYPN